MSFKKDFSWQRALIPHVKRACAEHLISEAPAEEDMHHNTDLIVLRLDTVRVACRLRRHNYLGNYADEFTIRASRGTGADTELRKIIAGWGDYIFYGFASADESSLAAWILADLKVFRVWYNQQLYAGRRPGQKATNGDGSSTFLAFKIDDLPPGFLVARLRPELSPS